MNVAMMELAGLGSGVASVDVKPHRLVAGAEQMIITLENGFGLSILTGGEEGIYTKGGTFEVATLNQNGNITEFFEEDGDGVYGFLTHEEVGRLLVRVSHLKDARIAPIA